MNPLVILSSAGGGVTVIAALIMTVRAIFHLVHATEENTEALHEVRDQVKDLNGKLDGHETRISRLEGSKDAPRARGRPRPQPR